ncbi:MFS transporter [Acinetobacter vivianii]
MRPPFHKSNFHLKINLKFVLRVVGAVAFAHLLNDSIQAVVTASYPMLKAEFSLSFAQIGWIALVYQITASLLQPWIGLYTDKHPKPYLLPAGMFATLIGIGLMAIAGSYHSLLLAAALIGIGSSTFHPEASRIARTASGGRFGTAQSMFQVGGNTGSALGPLVAAAVIIPNGQGAIGLFVLVAALAIFVLLRVTKWLVKQAPAQRLASQRAISTLTRKQVIQAMAVICILLFAKFIYIAAITNYFTFYLIERFNVSIQTSQLYLFIFLGAVALGTFAGGPVGDRIGRKAVVWVSFRYRAICPDAALCRPNRNRHSGHYYWFSDVFCLLCACGICTGSCTRSGWHGCGLNVWTDVRYWWNWCSRFRSFSGYTWHCLGLQTLLVLTFVRFYDCVIAKH